MATLNKMHKFYVYVAGILLVSVGVVSAGTSYIHSNGQLIAKINETGNVTYYHPDNLGSTSVLTDSKGGVLEEQVNLPFGGRVFGDEKFGFAGKEKDENGLHYYMAR